ncbi:hypothetical protein FOZ63_008036 [Perkinsus olseni]|uniref:Uncharacterized protein n=1 Tax=Perkinsus olseni TaxID=32597 RepID=A0A7J6NEW8_PEROL|nr:hypothetical protein FOZ60_010560 [Perkinsus olseni]KAF4697195.1 hypothetical protein FOZ62_029610 [Perkinsus olseni]KAF4756566.1 hypothetical protein FOZ63_008036 [Perkinsus olseni]
MPFTQLFAVACVLFPVAESLTKGKYCGLQQVAFRTPALYACITFDYDDSTSSATLGYNSRNFHSLTIGYDDVSVKEDGVISLKRQGFTENDHPFPNVELHVRLVVDAEKKDTINVVDAEEKILYTLTTEQCQRSLSLDADCRAEPANSSRALQATDDGSPVPSGEYYGNFSTHEVHLSAYYEDHRFGEYKFVGRGPTTFEYNSGYTQLELEQTFPGDFGGGYVLDMAYYWANYSKMLFNFNVDFVYYPFAGMFNSYFDKVAQTSEFKRLTRA